MRLSKLQKFILQRSLESRNSNLKKSDFFRFYGKSDRGSMVAIQSSVQESLDNLVEKNLLVAYGHHTAQKWHIEYVRLTPFGKKTAREIMKNRQKKLPKI